MRRITVRTMIALAGAFFIMSALLPSLVAASGDLVTREAVTEITLTGYSRRVSAATITAEVTGKVLNVNYDVGETATAEPYVEVDTTFVDFRIQEATDALRRLEVSLRQARSRAEYLQREFKRIDTLHKGDRATGVRRDAARQDMDQSRLELERLGFQHSSYATKLEELGETRQRHSVYLPRGWRLTARSVQPGEVVSPGIALGRVADFRQMVVPLSVAEAELKAMRALKSPLKAMLNGRAVRAKLIRINPEFDERTRKRSVELLLSGYGAPHEGGLRFEISLAIRAEGFVVPRAAVIERYSNPRVRLKGTGETVRLLVIGTVGQGVLVSPDARLTPGTALMPAEGN